MPVRKGIKMSRDDAARYDKCVQEAAYYDRLQYVYKIKLNSFYGALTNKYFRFFDLRMGESTTGTGRKILSHQCAKVNQLLDGAYEPTGKAIIYGDTDSSYFETFATNKEEAVDIADRVAAAVNKSYPKFMRETFLCSGEFAERIKAGREIVSDRGIFVEKKRYILHIVDSEGRAVDKLKVMGLDTKKTTLPKHVSKELNRFIERLLKGETWDVISTDIVDYKNKLYTIPKQDVLYIGLPKGVKRVEFYTEQYLKDEKTRLPGHVAASIFYNQMREQYKDMESPAIMSGMKIKVFYLTKMFKRFKSIAIPGDLEKPPQWFLDNFEVNRDAHVKRLVDNPLDNILKAIGKHCPSKQSLLIDDLFVF